MMFLKSIRTTIALSLALAYPATGQVGTPAIINVSPFAIAMTDQSDTKIQTIGTTLLYTVNNSCQTIGQIYAPTDLHNVTFTVKVHPDAGLYQGQPYVGRYYDVQTTHNRNAPADISLFFSQADFDAYNRSPQVVSGSYPPVANDGSNLLISIFQGSAGDGTSGPGNEYSIASLAVVHPQVTEIIPGIFQVRFTSYKVAGGYFAHTNTINAPLNVDTVPVPGLSTINAWPNPFTNEIFVDIKGPVTAGSTLMIVDNLGRVLQAMEVKANGVLKLTTQHLSTGIYQLVYTSNRQTQVLKISKKD